MPLDIMQIEIVIDSIEVSARSSIVFIEIDFVISIIFSHLLFDSLENTLLWMINSLLFGEFIFSCFKRVIVKTVAIYIYIGFYLL